MEENPITAQPPLVSFQFKTKHHLNDEIAFELTEEELESLMAKLASIKQNLAAHKPNPRTRTAGDQRAVEDILFELAGDVPDEAWEKLPKDLNKNLDHYVYGIPAK